MASLSPRYHFRAASECSAWMTSYRSARSRSARGVMLTRYAMPVLELVEKFPGRPDFSLSRILQALTDAFLCIGPGGDIEQSLIGFGVLDDGRRLPLHGEHHGALVFS